jgi:hypothetical protein
MATTLYGHSGSRTKFLLASSLSKILKKSMIKKTTTRRRVLNPLVQQAKLIASFPHRQLTKRAQVQKKI